MPRRRRSGDELVSGMHGTPHTAAAAAIHAHLLDQDGTAEPSGKSSPHIQRACARWIALRRTHLGFSDDDIAQRTGLDTYRLTLVESGISQVVVDDPRIWRRLAKLLAADRYESDWVAEILRAACGQGDIVSAIIAEQVARDLRPRLRLGEGRVLIVDTTLHDGAKAPGRPLTIDQKLDVAIQLCQLQADVLEVGHPGRSPEEFASVQNIAQKIGTEDGPTIMAFASATRVDVDRACEALQPAFSRRINIAIPVFDTAVRAKKLSRERVLRQLLDIITYVSWLGIDVQITAVGATEADRAFLYDVVGAAIAAGASIISLPDTAGYATPTEYMALITDILREVPRAGEVIIAVHCHNDLGLAVANTLAGLRAGATQVECTVNGIGERAGNAPVEEVATALKKAPHVYGCHSSINTDALLPTSRLIVDLMRLPISFNKPVVGPYTSTTRPALSLTRYTTLQEFGQLFLERGMSLNTPELIRTYRAFKHVAHKQSSFSEQDIVGLVLADEPDNLPHYRLASLHVVCGTVESPTATVQLIGRNGNLYTGEEGGVGPVDAISKAIRKTVAVPIQLIEIAISAMTQGTLAHAEVTVYVREEPEALVTEHNDEPPAVYCGYATNLDTVVATAEAYLDALNQLLAARQQRKQRSVAQMRAAQALLDHEHE